jgi:hypothetical protein
MSDIYLMDDIKGGKVGQKKSSAELSSIKYLAPLTCVEHKIDFPQNEP